jgi:hypothetical protein
MVVAERASVCDHRAGADQARLHEDAVIAMSVDELLSEIYGWIAKAEEDTTSDALCWLVTEALERFAPEAEARQLEQDYTTGAGAPDEFETARARVRRRKGARMIRAPGSG